MTNTERNRQIVQEGLNCKKTDRIQRMTDAAHDAAERQLRATINRCTQERREKAEAAEAEQRRKENIRRQKAYAMAKQKKYAATITRCAARLFTGTLYMALVALCVKAGTVDVKVALAAIGLATIFCIGTLAKHTARITRSLQTSRCSR